MAARNPHGAGRSGAISAASNKSGLSVGNDGADCGNVAVSDRIDSVFLRSAVGCVYQNDIRIAPGRYPSTIQAVYPGIAARCCGDGQFRRDLTETSEMSDRVEHTKRHNSATRWSISGNDEAVERIESLCQRRRKECRAKISCGADLQRNVALADNPLEIRVPHRRRAAIYVEGYVGPDRQEIFCS